MAADLLRALRERRSVRRYTAEPVAREQLLQLLEIAGWAPSAHNRQPWRFAVVQSEGVKQKLAAEMGARLRADRLADGDAPALVDQDTERSRARIVEAPAVIVACMTVAEMDSYADDRRTAAEGVMAVQSTAMAVQNLLLAAHAGALGACWMCAPLFCQDTVAAVLQLPVGWQPQALITVGHPAAHGKPAMRRAAAEMVHWL
ncbi:MAG: nitroreductase family protein [Chloroflexi bacterium]|nr:nitroreductase family protein [Chloroflexota bacterium]